MLRRAILVSSSRGGEEGRSRGEYFHESVFSTFRIECVTSRKWKLLLGGFVLYVLSSGAQRFFPFFFFFLHFLMRGLSEGIVNRGTFVRRDRRIFNLLKSKISIINSRHTSTILHSNYVSNSQKSSLPFQLPYSSSILILDDLKPFQTISNHPKPSQTFPSERSSSIQPSYSPFTLILDDLKRHQTRSNNLKSIRSDSGAIRAIEVELSLNP